VYSKKRLFHPENAMLKRRLQSTAGRVDDFFAGEYVLSAAEETERAYFGTFFPTVHLKVICGFV
jgi:hypothetical protein